MKKLRFLTAASLFDGHDVSINIMRRMLQAKGVEVIHLGHNRSAKEVVDAAIQEDVHAVALSSYQGGHVEYFTYIRELLDNQGANNIRIFGGGGGVITATEIKLLESRGVTKIYSPQDGMELGLNGIIDDMIKRSEHSTLVGEINLNLAKVITFIEDNGSSPSGVDDTILNGPKKSKILGITGTGGAGKSSLIDELLLRYKRVFPNCKIALISVDPTKKKTAGALLGDRIRLGSASFDNFYIRSLATRDSKTELSPQIKKVTEYISRLDFDLVLVETSGIGQASDEITKISDKCIYVMTPEYGAQTQLEKIEMIDAADFIVLNKFERPRADDALRDIRKEWRRSHGEFDVVKFPDEKIPVYGTIAGQFNDPGVNALFYDLVKELPILRVEINSNSALEELSKNKSSHNKKRLIAPERMLYLREISSTIKEYNQKAKETEEMLIEYEALEVASRTLPANIELKNKLLEVKEKLPPTALIEIQSLDRHIDDYLKGAFCYTVRDKKIEVKTKYESLSHNLLSKVATPKFKHLSDKYWFIKNSNLPGHFPYSNGIFPFKRADEDPKRMFAGEGGPLRTNKRFHFLSKDDKAKRLSTAFDSATLYGEDPDLRPDIFGKIGEAGVSIATLQDMQDLFSGFKLTDPSTSVSMTINGPAPILLAFFMNTAIRQELPESDWSNREKCIAVMQKVRGTVQADILKEDQAQNTCIFSLEFALKMMGDVQEYFCKNAIKNYYTVSISGYHIAEAGANPISQMAFTLSNGFTFVEYYLSRGMKIDDFSSNLSFFFSNGLDPEYSVMGRVARKIWAVVMKEKYGASEKSQQFKYHVQTSGRSLHAQEIDFNDIRTTLQAFLALSDNCNSLHTNAYDEAITTPTEESVRRAMAIQMIINREFGLNKTENPLQGSFIIEELASLVEEQVLLEFERISDKGGVLGAMESMYQRGKIQEESLYYETLKDSGAFPIIGVNTYIAPNIKEQFAKEIEISRCTDEEKNDQILRLNSFKEKNKSKSKEALFKLREVALKNENIFEELINTVNYATLGEITSVLYEIGGKYRRNM